MTGAATSALDHKRHQRKQLIPLEGCSAMHAVRPAVYVREYALAVLIAQGNYVQEAAYGKSENKQQYVEYRGKQSLKLLFMN